MPRSRIPLVLVVWAILIVSVVAWRPVVLMHGIGASASSMSHVVQWIEQALPGVYVKNIEIGNGNHDSFFWNMPKQLDSFIQQVQSDPKLSGGFNLIGYSQGGLISRGFVERCNSPRVHNLITWSSPHGGQFGVPEIDIPFIKDILGGAVYEPWLQDRISFANYWKDPLRLSKYIAGSIYLSDLNNEKPQKNTTFARNIASLDNLVLVKSEVDNIIVPRESGWFYFYAENSKSTIVPLEKSDLYTQDWIGLRKLNEAGRLHMISTRCRHQDYPEEVCKNYFESYTLPYLKN